MSILRVSICLVALLVFAFACTTQKEVVPADALVLTNGIVIDGTGQAPQDDTIVIVENGKIVALDSQQAFDLSAVTNIVDLQGQTLLPGIINSHTHFTSAADIRRHFLVDGVTSVCDLGCSPAAMAAFEQQTTYSGLPVARGFKAGQIFSAAGNQFDSSHQSHWYISIHSVAEAANNTTMCANDVDYIKLALEPGLPEHPQPVLSAEELKTIAATAHEAGVPVRVHARQSCVLDAVLDARVDSIEHVPLPFCLETEWTQASATPFSTETYPELAAQLQRMADQEVYLVPTLEAYCRVCENPDLMALDPLAQFDVEAMLYAIVGHFNQLGGNVALGTDYGVPGTQFGMPLDEMTMLHEAGLTEMEIIEAATHHAAVVCGQADNLGTLEPGKLADMIVVSGNPLESLSAFDAVQLVILGGEVVCASGDFQMQTVPDCGN